MKVRDLVDNYEKTVQALLAFVLCISDREDNAVQCSHSLGRKLITSERNSISTSSEVTPDAVIQIGEDLGYVVEAKRSLGLNEEYWGNEIAQLRKYDDDLTGWWTQEGRIEKSDLILLIWVEFVNVFTRYLNTELEKGVFSFSGPVAIASWAHLTRNSPAIWIDLRWGKLSDEGDFARLQDGITITVRRILNSKYSNLKFYGDKPAPEYVMVQLWQNIFTRMAVEAELSEEHGSITFEVSCSSLTVELQNLYGSVGNQEYEREYPQHSWVREAMDKLEEIGLTKRNPGTDNYIVFFKNLKTGKKDLVEQFSRWRDEHHSSSLNLPEQLDFLDTEEETTKE